MAILKIEKIPMCRIKLTLFLKVYPIRKHSIYNSFFLIYIFTDTN